MEINIDFDEFKNHIQNRENAIALLGANRKLMFPYRISGDILFEKNKMDVDTHNNTLSSKQNIFRAGISQSRKKKA